MSKMLIDIHLSLDTLGNLEKLAAQDYTNEASVANFLHKSMTFGLSKKILLIV